MKSASKDQNTQKNATKERGPHELLILNLLKVIPSYSGPGQGISIKDIQKQLDARGFERDIRTIQRKVQAFETEYLDVSQGERSFLVQLKEGLTGINFGNLSRSESFLLTLAYKQLDSMLPTDLKLGLANLFTQAKYKLNNNPHAGLDLEWMRKIYTANSTQPLIPKESNPGILENVSNALYENHYLKLKYVNKVGQERDGEVMPLALVQQGNKMLLVCRCHAWDQSELQRDPGVKTPINWNLMLHRIVTAEVMPNRSFHYPKDFDVKEYERQGGFGIGNGRMVKLSFDMKRQIALSLLETKLSTDQEHVEHGDWITIKATVADTFILDHWLRGFGEAVRNIVKADDSN